MESTYEVYIVSTKSPKRSSAHLKTEVHRALINSCDQVVEVIPLFNEFIAHEVINIQEVVRVLPGIVNKLLGEWPYPPVCSLEHLVGLNVAEAEEQGSQRASGVLKYYSCLVSIKEVHYIHPTVTLQPKYVEV